MALLLTSLIESDPLKKKKVQKELGSFDATIQLLNEFVLFHETLSQTHQMERLEHTQKSIRSMIHVLEH